MNTIEANQVGDLTFLSFPELSDETKFSVLLEPTFGKNYSVVVDALIESEGVIETKFGKSIKVTIIEFEKLIKGLKTLAVKLEQEYEGKAILPIKEDGTCWLKIGKTHEDYEFPEGVTQGSIVKLRVKYGAYMSTERIGFHQTFIDMTLPKPQKKKTRVSKKTE